MPSVGVAGERAEREVDQGDARGDDQAVEYGKRDAGRLDARLSVLDPAREEHEAVVLDRQHIGNDGRGCPHQGRRWGEAHDQQPDKRAERPAENQNGHDCQRRARERAAGGRRNQAAAREDRQFLQPCRDVIAGACDYLNQGPAQALFRLPADRCLGLGLRREQQLQIDPGEDQTEDGEHEQYRRTLAHLEKVIGIGVAHPGKHGGGAAGAAAGHDPEQIERHDRVDRGQDHGEQQHRLEPRQGDPEEALKRPRTVDTCRTVQVLRHRLEAGQDQQRGQGRLVPDVHERDQIEGDGSIAQPVNRLLDQPEIEQDGIEGSVLAVEHPSPEHTHGDRRHRPGDENHAPQKVPGGEDHVENQRHAHAEQQPAGNRDEGEVGSPAERGDELGIRQDVDVVVEPDEDPLLGQHVDAMHAERQRVDQWNAENDEDDEQRRRRQQKRKLDGWLVGARPEYRERARFKQSR